MQRELASSLADAEWSAAAAKLASQSSVAGGTVRMLGAKHECKYPLCDARVSARPRCKPGRDISVALAVAKPRGLGN